LGKRRVVPAGKQRVRVAEGVYLKRSGRYLATFRDPGRKQHWREFATKAEAERWRAQGRLDPRSAQSGKRELISVWSTFLEHHGTSMARNTRLNWEQEWSKHIGPALGSWAVGKITIPAVKTFLSELERQGVGAPTRAKCRAILHRVLEEAVENGEIASNPVSARGTRVRLGQRRKARVLSADEVRRVILAAGQVSGPGDALAVEVMFVLGLRIGEMAGLQARDVDLRRFEITVQRTVSDTGGALVVKDATKSNRYRVLPVPEGLPIVGRLREHLTSLGLIGQSHLFQAATGGPLRPNNWRRRVWAASMARAGIEAPPTPHAARRTTSSLLSDAGVPPATIQAILGHSTLQQTGEYIDVPSEAMRQGLSRLAAVYSNPAP
jgi:integrase